MPGLPVEQRRSLADDVRRRPVAAERTGAAAAFAVRGSTCHLHAAALAAGRGKYRRDAVSASAVLCSRCHAAAIVAGLRRSLAAELDDGTDAAAAASAVRCSTSHAAALAAGVGHCRRRDAA